VRVMLIREATPAEEAMFDSLPAHRREDDDGDDVEYWGCVEWSDADTEPDDAAWMTWRPRIVLAEGVSMRGRMTVQVLFKDRAHATVRALVVSVDEE